jgi:molybdopterin biosynthesis enzyme MoaB
MRTVSPRGLLSRAVAGTRGSALILNLAAAPDRAVQMLDAVLDAVPEVIGLLGGSFVPTVDAVEPNLTD